MSITLKDFQPINNWKVDLDGEKYNNGEAKFIIDQTTNRRYFNETGVCIQFKCILLTLGTPFIHPIASIVNVVYRTLKLVSFYHFRMQIEGETKYNFKGRVSEAGKDLLRIIATPISLIGLELAAIYGIFNPFDGRKLYATIERAAYGHFILAPCFQPDPKYHAFGGKVEQRNAF